MMMTTNLNYFATRALLIVSLILIVVYLVGDPVLPSREDRAFYFAAPAIVISIVAFGISFREKSVFVSILLVINGIILVVDGIIVNYNYLIAGYLPSQASGFILSLVVLGIGIVKSIMTFRKTQTTKIT
jgi:hypothetical protein